MVKLVVRLSRGAKIAATVAMLGGVLTVLGRLRNIGWLGGVGTIMLFGGVAVYYVERVRMMRLRSREKEEEPPHRPLGPRHED